MFWRYWLTLDASFCRSRTRCMATGSSSGMVMRWPVAAWAWSLFWRLASRPSWSTRLSGKVLAVTRIRLTLHGQDGIQHLIDCGDKLRGCLVSLLKFHHLCHLFIER